MYRYIYNDLVEWKNSSYRKPLILNGARQTGKTWILNLSSIPKAKMQKSLDRGKSMDQPDGEREKI